MISNQDLADRAREVAQSSDGMRRRAALCAAVAAGTTGTIASARKALRIVQPPDLQRAAFQLLDELAELAGEGMRR